jgi:SAM-dependent methyltransferase
MILTYDLSENAFGQRKRLHAAAAILEARAPRTVLDVGCGSGQLLTVPLAQNFRNIEITGLDEDAASIDWARSENPPGNLCFVLPEKLSADARFDLIIASEVIEHVENPAEFLIWMRSRLTPGGVVFLTLPNGFGPYEMVTFLYQLAGRVGMRRQRRPAQGAMTDTLAASPHINFFSFRVIRRVIAQAGFTVLRYQPRTFLCGGIFDRLMAGRVEWNAQISESLPAGLVSDWMFLIEPATAPSPKPFRRSAFARLRRRFNEDAVRTV